MPTSLMRSPQTLFSLRPMSSQLIFTGWNWFRAMRFMKSGRFQRLVVSWK